MSSLESSSEKNGAFVHTDELSLPKHVDTRRKLKPRHIQFIAIGGSVGTALFVSIGGVLEKGGSGNLFVAFTLWSLVIILVTNSTAEMVTRYPTNAPFVRLAGRCIDPALEVVSGWNFFILDATLVPFEITMVTLILYYWKPGFNPAISVVPQFVIYFLIQLCVPVDWYGEVEFWFSLFKVLLAIGLFLFTFVTMVGGNPQHHAYGFHNFMEPEPFLEYIGKGDTGRFIGFMVCLSAASYYISGPDYVSIAAGEAKNPRKTLPRAFIGVAWRITLFYALGSLGVGVICSARDPQLLKIYSAGGAGPGANASPYVIGMQNMGIKILPHFVNAAVFTTAFSAGNSYFYCASRTLYSLAKNGQAPAFLKWCTKHGVPYMACLVVCCFALLALMQLTHDANTVLNWILAVATVSQLFNYALIQLTYLKFYYACKVQGVDRNTFAYKGWCQPYCAYVALVLTFLMCFFAGFQVFLKGNWSVLTFIFNYVMIPVNIIIYVGWKLWFKTKWRSSTDIDLTEDVDLE